MRPGRSCSAFVPRGFRSREILSRNFHQDSLSLSYSLLGLDHPGLFCFKQTSCYVSRDFGGRNLEMHIPVRTAYIRTVRSEIYAVELSLRFEFSNDPVPLDASRCLAISLDDYCPRYPPFTRHPLEKYKVVPLRPSYYLAPRFEPFLARFFQSTVRRIVRDFTTTNNP